MKKKIRIAENLYQGDLGFYLRTRTSRGKSWRKLASLTAREARREAAVIQVDEIRAASVQIMTGSADPDPGCREETVGGLIKRYLSDGCRNARLERRNEAFQKRHRYLLTRPARFFGSVRIENVRMPLLLQYAEWARHQMHRGVGSRTIDMELSALSGVFRYAVSMGLAAFNPVMQRPRFQSEKDVRHCREVAPLNGSELHRIVEQFFEDPRSEVLGWQCILEALSGCRTGEILKLRMDATVPEHPGFVDGGYLFIERSKKGVNPYVLLHPDLMQAIEAHHHWHSIRFANSPWWFPGRENGQNPVDTSSLSHGLARVCRLLEIPHRSSHGLRSYYVTARRGQGISDWQIAAEIGDRTVHLIHQTYGDRPANYRGGSQHTWRPASGEPSWARWLPENTGVISMPGQAQAS